MAKAYLGKISALVTANTSDFNSKLNASKKEVDSFARSMQATITRAGAGATASLRGIYTESQKVSRALQAAATQRLSFKGFDNSSIASIREAVDQFKALQNAAVNVNEPLGAAARTIERLSASVQGSFDPALKSAQKSAEYLSAALNRGGIVGEKSFDRIQKKAIAAAEAADRLAEASQLASSGPRGTELAFVDPRARDALARSAAARQAAANAPALVLEFGNIGEQVKRLVEVDSLIENVRAELESAIILKVDTVPTQAKLNDLISQSERLSRTLSEAVDGTAAKATAADAARRAQAASSFLQVNQSESALLSNQGAASTVDATGRPIQQRVQDIARLRELEQQAAQATLAAAEAQEEAAAATRRRVDAASRLLEINQSESTLLSNQGAASTTDATGRSIQQRVQDIARLRELERQSARNTPDAQIAPVINRNRAQRESAIDFGLDLDAPKRQIEVLRGSIVSLKGQLDTLPAGIRSQFIPAIVAAQQNLERLSSLPAATTAELSQAAREVDRLSQALGRASQAANIPSFRRFASELSTRAAVGELQALQSLLSRIGAEAGGPAAQAYDRYAAALRRATREGTTQLPETRRELERLTTAAARAASETGRISFGGALREIRRGGDIARGGFDNFSLALNQAAFAVDDFFSSTGGLEFRLRAISNNITQLAFILGGTTGLFVGLAAVIGGQLAVAITKFVNEGRTAEDQTKALNDALARQKSLVEELAQAFQSLGDSLTRDAFSPAARQANEFRKELGEIIKKQKELRDARVADADPTVQRERATQGSLQRRLDTEENIGRRFVIQQQLEESRRREREAAATAVSRTPDGVEAMRAINDAGQALFANRTRGEETVTARDTAVLDEARARAGAAAGAVSRAELRKTLEEQRDVLLQSGTAESDTAVANAIARLQGLIAALDAQGVRQANDALVISVLEGAKKVSDALAAAQSSIANADFGPSRIGAQADAAARQLESLAKQLETATDEKAIQALKAQQEALLKVSLTLRSAASSVEQFAAVIDRVARQLSDTVLKEVEGRANQARREANAAGGAVDAGVGFVPDFNRDRARNDRRRRLEEARADRLRAEADVQRAREGQQEFERRRRTAVRQFEVRAEAGLLGQEAEGLVGQRNQAQAVLDNEKATVAEQQQATETLASVNARLDQLFQNSTLGTALAEFADGLDMAAQAAAERDRQIREQRASADRGRDLTLTPGERAAEELNQRIADISEYADRAERESAGLPEDIKKIRDRMKEAIARAEEDMMRQVAPTITGMADSVRNAVLLGPSRAALNASDATTTQGQQELNRLLRGDDPARDVDMVALQRETNEILRAIERKENPVAQ